MSFKVHTKAQLRWYGAVFKVITNRYEELLMTQNYAETVEDAVVVIDESVGNDKKKTGKETNDGDPEKARMSKEEKLAFEEKQNKIQRRRKKIDKAKWRLGLNLYKAGDYFKAAPLLEYCCTGGSVGAHERG